MRHLCLALLLLLVAIPGRADIIPRDMKAIYVSATLRNMADYPGYVFVQLETLGSEVRAKQVIAPEGSVNKGYKFNRLEILAIPKDYFDAQGGLGGIRDEELLANEKFARSGDAPLESGQQLVPRPSGLAGKDVSYRITSLADGIITLEKTGEKIHEGHPNHFPGKLFAHGFAITFAVELIAFLLLVRFGFRIREPGLLRALLAVLVAQTATLPLLWFTITRYDLAGSLVMIGAESFAVGVECVIYRLLAQLSWKRAFLAALICNALSYSIGLLA